MRFTSYSNCAQKYWFCTSFDVSRDQVARVMGPPRTNQGPGTYPPTKVQGHRATKLRGSGVRQGPAKDPPGTHQGRSKVRLARGHGPWAELIIKNRALNPQWMHRAHHNTQVEHTVHITTHRLTTLCICTSQQTGKSPKDPPRTRQGPAKGPPRRVHGESCTQTRPLGRTNYQRFDY